MFNTKSALRSIRLFLTLLFLAALFVFDTSYAKQPKPATGIPIIGKTADGKYPVYALKGDLDDFSYFAGGKVWNSADLLTRMVFLDPKDVASGKYHCSWICKDGFQNVVGLNPANKGLVKQ